jgi:hypothetical protein
MPELERLRTVAEPRSSSWQPEIAGIDLVGRPSRLNITSRDFSCSGSRAPTRRYALTSA